MPARRRQPGMRLGLDRRSGPVGSAFLVDVADDILAIDCDSADRVEVVQEIATELQGHGYRPFGLLPVGPVTNICSSPSFVERQAGRPRTTERTSRSNPTRAKSRHVTEQDDLGSCHDESHGMSHRHHSDRAATRDDRNDGCGAPYLVAGFSVVATAMGTKRPLFPWIEFQSRRPTAAEMSAWYRRDPRAGVAIVCDAVSGLAVVDFDPRNSDGTARAVPRQEFCCLRQP